MLAHGAPSDRTSRLRSQSSLWLQAGFSKDGKREHPACPCQRAAADATASLTSIRVRIEMSREYKGLVEDRSGGA